MSRLKLPHSTGIEPILAWRTWVLTANRHGEYRLYPIIEAAAWQPHRPKRAKCRRHRLHRAPAPECTCGLYGARDLDLIRRAKEGNVVGTVALWGRVIEHHLGYRGQHAYPQRLGLVCRPCFWQWGSRRSIPDVVARVSRRKLHPLCDAHLEIARRSDDVRILELLEPRVVERALLDTYGVDPLRLADQAVVGSQGSLPAS